jgi:glycosyltransferase involved in cell wall biosynthesis
MSKHLPVSGYVPFFNNATTVVAAVDSLRRQEPSLGEVFAIDDGSSDKGADLLEAAGVRVVRQPANLGRGAARRRAMVEARHEFVLCCDATNTLPTDFAKRALLWFEDPNVAALFGLITDPAPKGVVSRWRARNLFKSEEQHSVSRNAPLITFGTMVRARAVAAVGGYDASLRHTEDAELGRRLLAAGHDVIGDPSLAVFCNIQNSLPEVLERYWRWYAGQDESFGLGAYFKAVWFSIRSMAWRDLKAGDPLASAISLLLPQYQLWRFLTGRMLG